VSRERDVEESGGRVCVCGEMVWGQGRESRARRSPRLLWHPARDSGRGRRVRDATRPALHWKNCALAARGGARRARANAKCPPSAVRSERARGWMHNAAVVRGLIWLLIGHISKHGGDARRCARFWFQIVGSNLASNWLLRECRGVQFPDWLIVPRSIWVAVTHANGRIPRGCPARAPRSPPLVWASARSGSRSRRTCPPRRIR